MTGIANIGGTENFGRMGFKTLGYYITTSLLAIVTGLFFVNMIQPGVGADLGLQETQGEWADAIRERVAGRRVLVTGAAGIIGAATVRQLARFTPERAACQLLGVMDGLSPADSGSFRAWDGSPIPW